MAEKTIDEQEYLQAILKLQIINAKLDQLFHNEKELSDTRSA